MSRMHVTDRPYVYEFLLRTGLSNLQVLLNDIFFIVHQSAQLAYLRKNTAFALLCCTFQ